ncbi:MAG: ATPase [Hyphomonadaceae bacterium]|nr:ATPase [Hyphomonadaceae bacterium]
MNSIAAKRFYKSASVDEASVGVMLDERRLRTPANAVFAAPTRALAEAIAAEWSAQGDHIAPSTMPLTQLAFAAIDAAPARRGDLAAYVAKFGETDLLCHRADSPPGLVERQAQAWDPLLAWSEQRLGVKLPVVVGVLAAPTDEASIETLRAHADALDDFRLTALAQAAGASGSALIAFALAHCQIDAAGAFAAAALDDLWSQETWGRDEEAQVRLDRLRAEFEAIDRFFAALA